jgi:hypothetical protein
MTSNKHKVVSDWLKSNRIAVLGSGLAVSNHHHLDY